MGESLKTPHQIVLELPELATTERLAAVVSAVAAQGDVISLRGDLGAGKTAFARAFIRATGQTQDVHIDEVPSPTFTIVQLYDELSPPVWHVDLYRLEHIRDTVELGLEEAFADGISLIEWPELMVDELPLARLDINFSMGANDDARIAHVTPDVHWRSRLTALDAWT